jgi:hypothetical protein
MIPIVFIPSPRGWKWPRWRWFKPVLFGVGVPALLALAWEWGNAWLLDVRPWRQYVIPIASVHVWNQTDDFVYLRYRPSESMEWKRLIGGWFRLDSDGVVSNVIRPGDQGWALVDSQAEATEPFDLELDSGSASKPRLVLEHVVLPTRTHLRLRVDGEGAIWKSDGGEGWLSAPQFGDEVAVANGR